MKRKREEEVKQEKKRKKEEASKAKARERQIRQNESRKCKRVDPNAEKENTSPNFSDADMVIVPYHYLLGLCK